MSLKDHLAWWDSLTSVQKSSPTNISRLVVDGEKIRQDEIGSWADATRQNEDQHGQDEDLNSELQGDNNTTQPASHRSV
eukprot:SAG31_NODE_936_length_10870_cov_5.136966_8_plen_79_part_00